MDNQEKKRNIKSIKDFQNSNNLKRIKKLHAKDLKIKGIDKISEQLELIDQITSTESLFKNSKLIKKQNDD